ncbi:MAG TPA: ATP phosphoribosyltransferase [Anaerolineae bacterium]|nr:ATP phosphoribosyltransferase [Anaerolineae bacterium]
MLSLVLPKGSLEEGTMRLLEEADLAPQRKEERDYKLSIDDPRIGQVRLLRPQEIPLYVEKGYFDLGITGWDWVVETGSEVVEVMTLFYNKSSFGRPVKIVLAVAESSPLERAEDIPPGSRISTEYPHLTEEFFARLGIAVEIYRSYGATEAKVPDIADAVVDITETGATFRRQGLKIIATLLESTTKLIANKESYADPQKRTEIEDIKTLLQGAIAARGKVLIKLNVREEDMEKVIEILPAAKSPTIAKLFGTGYYAVESVVPKKDINLLIPRLKQRGAEDILELPISKIVD